MAAAGVEAGPEPGPGAGLLTEEPTVLPGWRGKLGQVIGCHQPHQSLTEFFLTPGVVLDLYWDGEKSYFCAKVEEIEQGRFARLMYEDGDVEEWVDLQREAFLVYPKPDEADELQPIGPIEVLPPVASSGENDLQHRDAEQHGKGAAKDPGASGRGQAKASVRPTNSRGANAPTASKDRLSEERQTQELDATQPGTPQTSSRAAAVDRARPRKRARDPTERSDRSAAAVLATLGAAGPISAPAAPRTRAERQTRDRHARDRGARARDLSGGEDAEADVSEAVGASDDRVNDWLAQCGLGIYAPLFAIHRVDWATLPHLTSDDLRDMGVVLVGHRRKLCVALAALQ